MTNKIPFSPNLEAIKDIAAGLGAAFFLLDRDFQIIWHNQVLRDWFGPLNYEVHPACYQLFMHRNTACEECPVQTAFRSKKSCFLEKIYQIKSKGKRHCFIDVTPIKNEKNEVTQAVVLLQDITPLKRLQEEIVKERDFSHKVIDNANILIITLDREARIISFNKTAEELTGYQKNEVARKNWLELFISPFLRKDISSVLEKMWRGEARHRFFECPLITKNGEVLMVSWRNTVMVDEQNNPSLILLIGEDITGKKHMEKQLIQSQKMAAVGQIAAAVAHEVNNPALVISGRAELLNMRYHHNPEVTEAAQVIKEQCERITEVTQRLLNFSHIAEPTLESADINQLLDNTLPLLKYQVKTANIKITKDYHPELPKLKINTKQMQEVFLNALRNATEAMREEGELTISTAVLENNVVIKVSDTGGGIARENLNKIFGPFYTTKPSGTGLGLFISQQIVHSHSGTIEVESAEGKGTRLTIKLPVFVKKSLPADRQEREL